MPLRRSQHHSCKDIRNELYYHNKEISRDYYFYYYNSVGSRLGPWGTLSICVTQGLPNQSELGSGERRVQIRVKKHILDGTSFLLRRNFHNQSG